MYNKTIDLKHGVLLVPEDTIILEDCAPGKADFAAALVEKSGRLPHIIVLLETPVNGLSEDEEMNIYDHIAGSYPDVEEILEHEIPAVIVDGNIVNAAEWLRSPHLGLFSVPEVPDRDQLYLGVGIIREG